MWHVASEKQNLPAPRRSSGLVVQRTPRRSVISGLNVWLSQSTRSSLPTANGGIVVSFARGGCSQRQSFPRKRESTPNATEYAPQKNWIPAFAGMTCAAKLSRLQMTPPPMEEFDMNESEKQDQDTTPKASRQEPGRTRALQEKSEEARAAARRRKQLLNAVRPHRRRHQPAHVLQLDRPNEDPVGSPGRKNLYSYLCHRGIDRALRERAPAHLTVGVSVRRRTVPSSLADGSNPRYVYPIATTAIAGAYGKPYPYGAHTGFVRRSVLGL
jgi:hypothetical protein